MLTRRPASRSIISDRLWCVFELSTMSSLVWPRSLPTSRRDPKSGARTQLFLEETEESQTSGALADQQNPTFGVSFPVDADMMLHFR